MLSLTVNTPKPLFHSSLFPRHRLLRPPRPPPNSPSKPLSVSALIIPPSSSYARTSQSNENNNNKKNNNNQQQQQIYQPFRPPPSPLPSRYRNLDTNARLDTLSKRLGSWFEYAPLITSLINEGFTSSTIEEITGIASIEQNLLVVAGQVRDSLVQFADEETASFFDSSNAPEILYAIRILNTPQRVSAARFIIANGFDGKKSEELARAIRDFPRRYGGERGWGDFDSNLPGDCLAFMYYRQAQEHKSASFLELSISALEKALEVVETDRARKRVKEDMEGGHEKEDGLNVEELVRVPVVRMVTGEVAESSVVVVFPVCRVAAEVEEAPWEVGMRGEFGLVEAEKGWSRWVVLPGWGPVAGLKKGGGGVVVAFRKGRGVLPWRGKRRDADEEVLVVVDREQKEVEFDSGFYLVVSGGNGSAEEGLKVERGDKLKEIGVEVSLGTVVLVVRPPREDQLPGEDDWE